MIKFPSWYTDHPNNARSGEESRPTEADRETDRGHSNTTGATDQPVPTVLGSSRRGDTMNIGQAGGVDGARPVQPSPALRSGEQAYQKPVEKPRTDQVEISKEARVRQKIAEAPDVRTDRIAELKALIDSGEYETDERIAGAVDRIIDESL